MLPIAKIQAILMHEKATPDETILLQFQGLSSSDALKQAVQVMADLSANPKISAEICLKCLLKLDEGMQPHLEQMTAKRLKVKLYNRDVGMVIEGLVYPYYRRLFSEYFRLLGLLHSANHKFSLEKSGAVLSTAEL